MAVTQSGSMMAYDNVKDTFPLSTALTGTITAVNNEEQIEGSGTLFSTELQVGEYIYVAALNEFRKIRSIVSDTVLYLYPGRAFTVAPSGATPRRIPHQTYREYSYVIDSAGTAAIDGITLPASTSVTRSMVGGVRPEPTLIDTTANSNIVNLTFQI